jgi:hypothetical protein
LLLIIISFYITKYFFTSTNRLPEQKYNSERL